MSRHCKNCAHAKRDWLFGWEFATCEAPQNKKTDQVTGAQTYKLAKYCSTQRYGDIGDCAEVGRWFAQKQRTVWMRVFGA